MNTKQKQPWPTKAVMNQIYEQHLWGGKDVDFYSGEGSYEPNIVAPYLEAVISFLKSNNNVLSISDLGCGDFNIGQHLLPYTRRYIAIDIVEDLINRNQSKFMAPNLEFHCLDIAKDKLPVSDIVILRQVLQHLSNAEIHDIVKKLKQFKYLIITEHLPDGDFIPNIDIISGQGIRLKKNSGVNVLESPFNLEVENHKILCETILEDNQSKIVTTLYLL